MDTRTFIGKIASDKNNRKLGKIIRVELMLGKTIKKNIPYALILVSRAFKKDIIVPIEAHKALKSDTQYVWIDITKEEFEEEAKRAFLIEKVREKYTGQILQQKMNNRFMTGIDYTGLNKAPKERKK